MDRGLFLGVLIIISEGNWEDKVEALMEALPGRDGSVYAHSAAAFVKSTRVTFLCVTGQLLHAHTSDCLLYEYLKRSPKLEASLR